MYSLQVRYTRHSLASPRPRGANYTNLPYLVQYMILAMIALYPIPRHAKKNVITVLHFYMLEVLNYCQLIYLRAAAVSR
jgi:hypothetical protein